MDIWSVMNQPAFWQEHVLPWAIRIAVALLIWLAGKWLAKRVVRITVLLMEKSALDATLVRFISNILHIVLLLVVAIAALDYLGVKTTSLLAVFGAAGLAVGLALKDSLSNFASGVMLILFRPFKVDDYIEAAGTAGVVEEVGIFATRLRTGDNRSIIVPNSQIHQGNIINYSAKPTRRIDLVFSIDYSDDIRQAKSLIEEVLNSDPRILADPAPVIMLGELAESSVDINVRPWVNSADYWLVRSDLLERVKLVFDQHGITIPYPQREMHMREAKSA